MLVMEKIAVGVRGVVSIAGVPSHCIVYNLTALSFWPGSKYNWSELISFARKKCSSLGARSYIS